MFAMRSPTQFGVAVLGASGYSGGELVRLIDTHPGLVVTGLGARSSAGLPLGSVHPHLGGGDRMLAALDPETLQADLVFLALPNGASAEAAVTLAGRGIAVADLGGDLRFASVGRFVEAYGADPPHPDQIGSWVYGIPELFGDRIRSAPRVAVAGCYPTAAVLALAPLLGDGLIGPKVVVDAKSGVSGAGRSIRADLMFGAVDGNVTAYGIGAHRHRPEIEQALEAVAGVTPSVTFTPHLVPMMRGLLATGYAVAGDGVTRGDLVDSLAKRYASTPFVSVVGDPPQTRWVTGSNRCLISVHLDRSTGSVVVVSVLDNLLKGSAGQAVQCANLMLGLPEETGLPAAGTMP
ncbi:N-acetyl-gamma-glutamyl-phosphate reductase [soil metagenome]